MAEVLSTSQLHGKVIGALGVDVLTNSDPSNKPLDLHLRPPLPPLSRVYAYRATDPPGGRTPGEHKIQLMVPGQARDSRGSFDTSGGHFVFLLGYSAELNVFILWDAYRYPTFTFSRNVQVKAETVCHALTGEIGRQVRRIRGQGEEIALTAAPGQLKTAMNLRFDITIRELSEGSRVP